MALTDQQRASITVALLKRIEEMGDAAASVDIPYASVLTLVEGNIAVDDIDRGDRSAISAKTTRLLRNNSERLDNRVVLAIAAKYCFRVSLPSTADTHSRGFHRPRSSSRGNTWDRNSLY